MERRSYSTDLTDDQWQKLQEHLPKARNGRTGRRRKYALREVVNALFYQLRAGCPWRDLPHDLPPWATVYDQFRRWRDSGMIECLHDKLSACTTTCAKPPARSRAVRPLLPPPFWTARRSRRAKKGAVRHPRLRRKQEDQGPQAAPDGGHAGLLVDTQGFLLAVSVQAGNVQDRDGAKEVLSYCKGTYPRLSLVWADSAYGGELVDWVASCYGWTLEIVRKPEDQKDVKGFAVQPHRWIVERTFAWLCKYRRLVKDYERLVKDYERLVKDYEFLTESSEAMIRLAMCHIMVRRLKTEVKTA